MQIAIIGAGNVGGVLGKGWARAGHAIAFGVPDPSAAKHRATAEAAGGAGLFSVPRAVQGADAIVLAVPFDAVGDALGAAGDLAGRLLVDVTNPLRRPGWSCRSGSTVRAVNRWRRWRPVRRYSRH